MSPRCEPIIEGNVDEEGVGKVSDIQIGRSLRWSYGLSALVAVGQLCLAAITARFLVPADYGLVAVAAGTLRFVQYLTDLGVMSAIIQKPDLDPRRDAAMLFSVALILNGLAVPLLWGAAPYLTAGGGAEGVAIFRFYALTLLFNGMAQTGLALARRRLDFRTIGLWGAGAMLVGQGLVTLPLAVAGFGAWSLVFGALAQTGTLALLVLSARLHPWLPQRISRARLTGLATLAGGFSVLRLLDSLGLHLLPLVVFAVSGATGAGLWDRMAMLTVIPLDMVAAGMGQVVFPVYSRLNDAPERRRETWLSALMLTACLGAAVAAGLAAAAAPVITMLLGPGWRLGAGLLGWLAVWGALRGIAMVAGSLLEGMGRLKTRGCVQAGYLLVLGPCLLTLSDGSVEDLARILVAVEAVALLPLLIVAARACGVAGGELAGALAAALLPALGVAGATAGVVALCGDSALVDRLAAGTLAVCTVAAAVLTGMMALAACVAFHPSRRFRRVIAVVLVQGAFGLDGPMARRLRRFLER